MNKQKQNLIGINHITNEYMKTYKMFISNILWHFLITASYMTVMIQQTSVEMNNKPILINCEGHIDKT